MFSLKSILFSYSWCFPFTGFVEGRFVGIRGLFDSKIKIEFVSLYPFAHFVVFCFCLDDLYLLTRLGCLIG